MREGLTCRRWGKKTKSKTQPLQVYILRGAWEKSHDESHDLRLHDEPKIDDDIIKVGNQIRKFWCLCKQVMWPSKIIEMSNKVIMSQKRRSCDMVSHLQHFSWGPPWHLDGQKHNPPSRPLRENNQAVEGKDWGRSIWEGLVLLLILMVLCVKEEWWIEDSPQSPEAKWSHHMSTGDSTPEFLTPRVETWWHSKPP